MLSPSLYSRLGYDPAAFVPVTIIVRLPYVLVAHPKVPASNIPELIAFAKANPDKLSFGSAGVGSAQHLAVEWLKTLGGVRMTHVPYRGAAPAMTDLLAGHVELMVDNAANVLHHIRDGRLKALAIGAPPRIANFPMCRRCRKSIRCSPRRAGSASSPRRRRRRPSPPRCHRPSTRRCACPISLIVCAGSVLPRSGVRRTKRRPFCAETERWRKVIVDAGIKLE